MAESKIVIKVDQKLIDSSIIDPAYEYDYQVVHNMLNTHVRKSGKILTEETFHKGDEALRSWLMTLYKQGASQEKLTSYLRCGLAHLCFDFIESTYAQIPPEDLIARTLQSFKLRNYHNCFFKVSQSALETPKKKAVKKVIKKKIVKKKSVKAKSIKAKKNIKTKKIKPKKGLKSNKKSLSPKKNKAKKTVKKKIVKKSNKKRSGKLLKRK